MDSLVRIKVGDRYMMVDSATARRAQARKAELDLRGRQLARQVRSANVFHRTSTISRRGTESGQAPVVQGLDNMQAWNRDKKARMGKDFEQYNGQGRSVRLSHMNAAFERLSKEVDHA